MLIRAQFMFKIIRNMVIYNKFKDFRKMIKNLYRSVITNREWSHRAGNLCFDTLRSKINLRIATTLQNNL